MKTLAAVMSLLLLASPVSAQTPTKGNPKVTISVPQTLGCSNTFPATAWSWGASQSGTTHTGSGGGAGRASIQDLSFTKPFDGCSPKILEAVVLGTILPSLTLTQYSADGVVIATLALQNVLFSSYSTGSSYVNTSGSGRDGLDENVTVNFSRLCFENEATGNSVCYSIAP